MNAKLMCAILSQLRPGASFSVANVEQPTLDDVTWHDQTVSPTQQEVDLAGVQPARDAVWERVKAERERRTLYGGYKVGQKWYHSDELSRTQQIGLVLLGANIPPNTQWKTMDGSFVPMTQQLAGQIFAAAAASDIAIFAAAEAHRAAMEQAPDPAAYDFSGGWPPAFGE